MMAPVHLILVDASGGVFPTPCGVGDAHSEAVTPVLCMVTCLECRRLWPYCDRGTLFARDLSYSGDRLPYKQ